MYCQLYTSLDRFKKDSILKAAVNGYSFSLLTLFFIKSPVSFSLIFVLSKHLSTQNISQPIIVFSLQLSTQHQLPAGFELGLWGVDGKGADRYTTITAKLPPLVCG